MVDFHERVRSINEAVQRLSSVQGSIDPEDWIDESLSEVDDTLWQIVDELTDEGRISS